MGEVRPRREAAPDAVAEYKTILKSVLERRPSGMRQKLAEAIGKNRSFVSQISNAGYQVPIPARHLALIFEICHFSQQERESFLKAYSRAHPGRFNASPGARRERKITLTLPDLESQKKNQQLEALVFDFVHRIVLLLGDER